ncbi:MAG TPA: FecR domain-containing protein [Chitinophaga sp.]|uniref:FecR family protein n=1 Tax=Chitinophaga sp. TaxID=1869181 RepID=UPI002B8DC9B7|nr:FecR domain-containing protein [Chitinophaga sp.]HVI44849.1 FecR domain-containing protein [Chitinophaga sp.]
MFQFRNWITAFIARHLSDSERQELNAFLRLNRDTLRDEIYNDLESGVFDGMTDPAQKQFLYERIMQRLQQKAARRVVMIRYIRIAATVLILTGSFSIWKYYHPTVSPVNKLAGRVSRPVKKVMLTLSDGSVVALDSARNGILARQGSAVVQQQGNSRLIYHSSGTTSKETLYNTISTPKGVTYEITLPDGSSALLNAASSIRFPVAFAKDRRIVEISGEVYFDVKKDAAPFYVKTENTDVLVLSTRFNVNSYQDENSLRITLLEGAVKVILQESDVLLRPGQQLAAAAGSSRVLNDVDLEEVMAWKNGNFVFNGQSLPEIMRQVGRWYDVDVEYEGEISKRHFTGIVSRNESLEGVLQFMQMAGIRYRKEGRRIIVIH